MSGPIDGARRPSVLVVDDDITGRALVASIVRKAGFEVAVAASGAEGLAAGNAHAKGAQGGVGMRK